MNLLNPDRIRKQAEAATLRIVVRTGTAASFILLATVLVLAGVSMALEQKLADAQSELARTKVISPTGASLPVQETTKRINRRLSLLQPLLAVHRLDERIRVIADALPPGVRLSQLSISERNRQLVFNGRAETRTLLPELQSRIDAIDFVESFSIASDINQRTDVALTATIVLRNADGGQSED